MWPREKGKTPRAKPGDACGEIKGSKVAVWAPGGGARNEPLTETAVSVYEPFFFFLGVCTFVL